MWKTPVNSSLNPSILPAGMWITQQKLPDIRNRHENPCG